MHRIVYVCVEWLYYLIIVSEHACMASVSCFRGIIPAVNVAWMGLQRALEREALEASFVVLAVCLRIARRLEKGSTTVQGSGNTHAGTVCWCLVG